jgi:uncharacterized protein involved in exopolysaccharide biosynthesis
VAGALARAALVVFVAALAGVAAYLFSERQPKEFVAQSQLAFARQFSPELQALGGGFAEPSIDEEVRIATDAEAVRSFDVADATARLSPELGMSPGEIAGRVTAEPVRGTLIVRVTATGTTPQEAARVGQAYTEAFRALRRDREREDAGRVERALDARLDALPRSSRRGPIGVTIRNQLSAIGVLRRVGSGAPQVIQQPRASSVAAKPQTRRNVLFGLLFGAVVGIGLVALRTESRSRTLASAGSRIGSPRG